MPYSRDEILYFRIQIETLYHCVSCKSAILWIRSNKYSDEYKQGQMTQNMSKIRCNYTRTNGPMVRCGAFGSLGFSFAPSVPRGGVKILDIFNCRFLFLLLYKPKGTLPALRRLLLAVLGARGRLWEHNKRQVIKRPILSFPIWHSPFSHKNIKENHHGNDW